MSQFIRHDDCPSCGRVRKLAVYDDNEHCFHPSCGYHKNYNKEGENPIADAHEIRHAVDRKLTPLPDGDQVAIRDRGIAAGSVNKYRVTVDTRGNGEIAHVYPYFDENGAHVANKVRRRGEKAFYWEGAVQAGRLFGQQLFRPGGKAITIVEGECDALATYQLTGSKYPCVSVKSASEAKKNCVDNYEYLNSFEKIVVCMDNDEPGQKAAHQILQLFAPGKVHNLKLEHGKDANDYLMKGLEKDFVNEWFRAPAYTPEGLQFGSDPALFDEIINYKEPESVLYPWVGLNKSTYGLRLGELTLLKADTGSGKTTFCKEIEHKLLTDEELIKREYGVGLLHLEEPKRDTALGLMSINANKPFHLPDTEKSPEELKEHYDAVVNSKRVVIYDHFGSNDIDVVLNKIRHMHALGCKYIVLDHLSIIVSDQSGDERKQLDEISTKLKMLTISLNICVVTVVHINRKGEVRGSAGPEQVANNVINLERDKKDPDEWRRNVTRVSVDKCRLSGRTGPVTHVWYDAETGRLVELTKEQGEAYEQGTNLAGNEFAAYG